ncbi:MAG: glycosyltransferase family 39 protein [Chitinivibrionales bacterium]|nr:glycosyltransferase family 39 protein [Chitinivibrionales bacterium]
MTKENRIKIYAECALVGLLLLLAFHFLQERIVHHGLPTGDEGSWMSAAAEFARGNGFSTRWLEYLFLQHWTLPRPDDFRYPGLVLVLAAAFKCFGISLGTALGAVAAVFLTACGAAYLVWRKFFGVKTALVTLALTAFSLLQLYWNAQVYTEGLFGLVLSLLLLATVYLHPAGRAYWIAAGIIAGLLYLVRPNAVLFAPAIVFAGIWYFKTRKIPLWHSFLALGAMFAVMTPWLARSWLQFGNPFYIAGNAGLLSPSMNQTAGFSVGGFIGLHNGLLPLKALAKGFLNLTDTLNFFEHGLEILPLAFAAVALLQKRTFYNALAAAGFLLSFCACCYVGYARSWAAVRYLLPFMPFVYAYGVHAMIGLGEKASGRFFPRLRGMAAPFVLAVCLIPVVNPHRYYERTLAAAPKTDRCFAEYVSAITDLVGQNQTYCAGSLAQLNFLCNRNCVGIQAFFDSSKVDTVVARFRPKMIVVTVAEEKDPTMQAIQRGFQRTCGGLRLVAENSYGRYYMIGAEAKK